jgi:predicted aminopeptidase
VRLQGAIVAITASLVAGCETAGYYSQAVGGHLALMSAARPADEVIADAGTSPVLRARLETALRIRAFAARELGLPDNASYTAYVELDRPYVVWNAFAAEEFSIEAKTHCFPFAGCVSYRGFFAERDAQAYAARLRAGGYDVFVAGVRAYSTLGWFDDPLLSTFLHAPQTEVARLVFHELAHQLVYVRDDTAFNESFATAVEQEGVRRWLLREGRESELAAFREAQARKAEFVALIEETRVQLAAVYRLGLPPAELRERKRAEFARLRSRYEGLKARWGGYAGFDRFFADEPNNALLAAFSAYTRLVPAFERLLAEARGDLPAFYSRVKELAALPREERTARLEGRLGSG